MRFGFPSTSQSSICWGPLRILQAHCTLEYVLHMIQLLTDSRRIKPPGGHASLTNRENQILVTIRYSRTSMLHRLAIGGTHATLALPCFRTLLLPPSSPPCGEKLGLQVRIGARIQRPERAQIGTRRKRGAMHHQSSTPPLPRSLPDPFTFYAVFFPCGLSTRLRNSSADRVFDAVFDVSCTSGRNLSL